MEAERTPSFGHLLRRYRLAAGLTQEALAEQAQVSARAISALERGVNQTPRIETLTLLVKALALKPDESAELRSAARPRDPPPGPTGGQPPPSPQVSPTNLPLSLTSFIGREQEQATVLRLLQGTRLLTLTGAGGCGKTRLALETVGSVVAEYPDGVWLVELAPLADPTLVVQAVARAVGVRGSPGRPLLATLSEALRPKHLLLVLDNCEHLLAACAELATALLRICPLVRILTTSREALRIAGETIWTVPSLSVPGRHERSSTVSALNYEAVRLFVDRAHASRPDFTLAGHNVALVGQICRSLDGIPLAIELAAARLSALSAENLAARLDDRFRLLTGGSRTSLPRHQTLRAALDWSYALLSGAEQMLLCRLSVFAGGWVLEAAEEICAGEGIEPRQVLDLLTGLVNKSLAQMEESGGATRYRLLETVRQYAREHLEASGGAGIVQQRYRDWYLSLAEHADLEMEGPQQAGWLDRLDAEIDNFRAVLTWSSTAPQGTELGLRLATALRWFWILRDRWHEGRQWLETTLAMDGLAPTGVRAAAIYAFGRMADLQGDTEQAQELYQQCRNLFRQLGDKSGLAYTLHWLSWHAYRLGDRVRGSALREESLGLFRELGDKRGFAQTLTVLGADAHRQSDYEQAAAFWEEALALLRDLGIKWNIALLLFDLGEVARLRGDFARAHACYAESVDLCAEFGNREGVIAGHFYLGEVACAQGAYDHATTLFQEGLVLAQEVDNKQMHIAGCLNGLGNVARLQGDHQRACTLLEESLAGFREMGLPGPLTRVLTDLGYAAKDHGDAERAAALFQESLALRYEDGYKPHIARNLEGLAALVAKQGQPERAARWFGTAAALREAIGAPVPPSDRPALDHALAVARAALGADAFQVAWSAGCTLGLKEAIAEAMAISTAVQ